MKTHTPSYVYVVEDDKGTNELMAFLLRQKGYHPVQNYDGKIDLNSIEKEAALFIIDIELPEVRGDALIEQIHANVKTKNIPVAVISANKHVEEVCKEHDVKYFLCKPFDVDDFKKMLNKVIEKN
jgi:response regulator RpfG family c-di-GMP phosphodiesterase